MLGRYFLHCSLVDDVAVGHRQGVGVVEIDLVLAPTGFALRELDGNSGRFEPPSDRTDDGLVSGGLEHVVVLDPVTRRTQTPVPGSMGIGVRGVEEEELDLASHHRTEPHRQCRIDLGTKDRTRGLTNRVTGLDIGEIANDESRLVDPRHHPCSRPVGERHHVPVPLVVACEAVTGHRIVRDVTCDEVVAVLRAVLGDVLEEEPSGRALSDEASEEIRKCHDDGVDVPRFNESCEGRPIEFVWCRHRPPDRDERATR